MADMKRTAIALAMALSVFGASTSLAQASNPAFPEPEMVTIYVTGMTENEPINGPTLEVRVQADSTRAQKDAAIGRAVGEYQPRERRERPSDVTPQATATVYGNCGWSSIEFNDAFGTRAAYVKARWVTNWPGTAYRVNIHVWDTSFDPSDWDFPDTGNLGGSTSYWDDFTFYVDESGEKYGAKMDRGEVYIPSRGTWCYTGVPTVDNITIY